MKIEQKMTLLIVEDEADMNALYKIYLHNEPYHIKHVNNGKDALAHLQHTIPNAILLDLGLPDMNGLEILKYINEQQYTCSVVIVTAEDKVELIVKAMRYKAFDFLVKPFEQQRFLITIRNALQHQQLSSTVNLYKENFDRAYYHGFIGACPAMQAVYQIIEHAASSNATVFITGESGTGKEICAEAIHKQSLRRNKPFIAINCAAIPKELMESEIFGHVKGAFTGAVSDRAGAVSLAEGGTLFLDEICEMDFSLQSKFLRFIQTRMVQKVGGDAPKEVDVRFICATNHNPFEEVKNGRFREDLYYRLYVIPIILPPLRERDNDILLIAKHFLIKYTKQENKSFTSFSAETNSIFLNYEWPGNVRELQNVIYNTIVLHDHQYIIPTLLPAPLNDFLTTHPHTPLTLEADSETIYPLWQIEKKAIEQAIKLCEGNILKAALLLEVSPSTIYRKRKNWI